MESLSELRDKVQAPVRRYNDVAGLLLGDHISIHVTRFFVRWRISPTVATLSMLFFGIAGSVMVFFGGGWSVAGFACVLFYYVLDCVDGEVARYHRAEKLIWGFHDFLFHLYVKSAFFICLGLYAVRFTGHLWMLLPPFAALLAVLFQKFQQDLTYMLICRYVLLRGRSENQHFVEQLTGDFAAEELLEQRELQSDQEPTKFHRVLPFLRAVLTNFDLSIALFLLASIADLWLAPFQIGPMLGNCKIALLLFYGVVLPLDFLDRLWSYMRSAGFERDARRLLRHAHHFRIRR